MSITQSRLMLVVAEALAAQAHAAEIKALLHRYATAYQDPTMAPAMPESPTALIDAITSAISMMPTPPLHDTKWEQRNNATNANRIDKARRMAACRRALQRTGEYQPVRAQPRPTPAPAPSPELPTRRPKVAAVPGGARSKVPIATQLANMAARGLGNNEVEDVFGAGGLMGSPEGEAPE